MTNSSFFNISHHFFKNGKTEMDEEQRRKDGAAALIEKEMEEARVRYFFRLEICFFDEILMFWTLFFQKVNQHF